LELLIIDIMNWLKNWPSIMLLVAGALASWATYVSSKRDQQQKDNIQKFTEQTVKLGELNAALSNNIQQISTQNNIATEETKKIVESSQLLVSQMSELTKQSQDLIVAINKRAEHEAAVNAPTGELFEIKHKFNDNDLIAVSVGGITDQKKVGWYKNGAGVFVIGKKQPFDLRFENGKLLFSLKVFDVKGNLVAEIENNKWRPNKNFAGKYNYDDLAFEVIDNRGNVAISLEYSSSIIKIKGIFCFLEEKSIVIAGKSTTTFPLYRDDDAFVIRDGKRVNYLDALDISIRDADIQPIFEYTGKDYLKKRRK
jgi:hypothetical protein